MSHNLYAECTYVCKVKGVIIIIIIIVIIVVSMQMWYNSEFEGEGIQTAFVSLSGNILNLDFCRL
jgi:hypothetical protein